MRSIQYKRPGFFHFKSTVKQIVKLEISTIILSSVISPVKKMNLIGIILLCFAGAIPACIATQDRIIYVGESDDGIPTYKVISGDDGGNDGSDESDGNDGSDESDGNDGEDNNEPKTRMNVFGEDDDIQEFLQPSDGILVGYDTPLWEVKSGDPDPVFTQLDSVWDKVDAKLLEKTSSSAKEKRKRSIKKRAVKRQAENERPDIVYPEILLVLDSDHLDHFNGDIVDALAYLLPFWNAIDLKYRELDNPKFRLSISAIVFAKDDKVLSYFANNKFENGGIDMNKILLDTGLFWYKQNATFPLDSYDIVTTMSPSLLCSKDPASGEINCGFGGFGAYNQICQIVGGQMRATLALRDRFSYTDIVSGAHELGHVFGQDHDNEGTPEEVADCMAMTHIMAPSIPVGPEASQWSKCSLRGFDKMLANNPKCILNKPKEHDKVLPRYLPGEIMDADAQCQALGKIKAQYLTEKICEDMYCVESYQADGRPSYFRNGPAADGTPCVDGKRCLQDKCLDISSG